MDEKRLLINLENKISSIKNHISSLDQEGEDFIFSQGYLRALEHIKDFIKRD